MKSALFMLSCAWWRILLASFCTAHGSIWCHRQHSRQSGWTWWFRSGLTEAKTEKRQIEAKLFLRRAPKAKCNRLPTLCRDRHLEGLQDKPPYILTCRSILLADYRSHFSYLLPHYFYLLRVYIEPLELYLQSTRSCNSIYCKAYSYKPGLHYLLNHQFTTLFQKPSQLLLPPL